MRELSERLRKRIRNVVKKSIVCLISAILLIACLFSGCGQSGNRIAVMLEADLSSISGNETSAVMAHVIGVISKRLNSYSVTGDDIRQQGENRILVELPSDSDMPVVKELMTKKGFLEFREAELNSQGQVVYLRDYLAQDRLRFINTGETGSRIFVSNNSSSKSKPEYITVAVLTVDKGVVKLTDVSGSPADSSTLQQYSDSISWIPARGDGGTALTGDQLEDAQAIMDASAAQTTVNIKWNSEGAEIFDQIALRLFNSGEYEEPQRAIGIFLDDSLLSAPHILATQYEGSCVISGGFKISEAQELANLLNSKALPVPVMIVELNTVSP